MHHVVLYSGGLASWRVAEIVCEREENVTLLFADTKSEDEDLYRFLNETSEHLGAPITTIADGRTVWEVFNDVKFIGNTRIDPCSRILKREPTRRWLESHCDPESTTVYLGFDLFEDHRFERAKRHWEPWTIAAPLVDLLETRPMIQARLDAIGIAPPRLYGAGFSHNNCRGACVKAGQGQWAHLLRMDREEYLRNEREEEAMRTALDKDISILRDQSGGATTPLTLRELRRRVEADEQIDLFDIRGCGCFAEGGE